MGGGEENRPKHCFFFFFRGKRHDNKILKMQILLSRNFVVIAQAPSLQSANCTKDFFWTTNFPTKNAPKFSPKFLSLYSGGSEKIPRNSRQIFRNISLPKIKKKNIGAQGEQRLNIFKIAFHGKPKYQPKASWGSPLFYKAPPRWLQPPKCKLAPSKI